MGWSLRSCGDSLNLSGSPLRLPVEDSEAMLDPLPLPPSLPARTGARNSRQGGRRRRRSGSRAAALSRGWVSSQRETGSHQEMVEGERQRRGRQADARGVRQSREDSYKIDVEITAQQHTYLLHTSSLQCMWRRLNLYCSLDYNGCTSSMNLKLDSMGMPLPLLSLISLLVSWRVRSVSSWCGESGPSRITHRPPLLPSPSLPPPPLPSSLDLVTR